MTRAEVKTVIAAPVDRVFETFADMESYKQAIPHIVDIEFLSERRFGAGTRFRETRLQSGKEATTELEITECAANQRLRIVTDSHGTIWDSLFSFRQVAEGTELTLTLAARAHQLAAKLMTPLVMPAVRSAVESDLEMLKQYCEAGGRPADPASGSW